MNRFFAITAAVLVFVTMSGCAGIASTGTSSGGTKPVIFLQRGVQLQVINNCGPSAKLYPAFPTEDPSHPTMGREINLPLGEPIWVPMAPNFLEATRSMPVTVLFFEKDVLLGTASRSFRVDRYSTQRIQWILGGDRSGGGQNVFIDRCPRALDRR